MSTGSVIDHPGKLTDQEYLSLERAAEFRSELHRGELVAMTGASRKTGWCLNPFLAASDWRRFIHKWNFRQSRR